MLKDLAFGKEAESELVNYLLSVGFEKVSLNQDMQLRYEYDVIAEYAGKTLTFEVKNDAMSAKTGNIALEYWNSKKNTPSGLYRTTANFWVHKFDGVLWISPVPELLNFTKTVKPHRMIAGGGDDNADLFLYRKESFKNAVSQISSFCCPDDFFSINGNCGSTRDASAGNEVHSEQ